MVSCDKEGTRVNAGNRHPETSGYRHYCSLVKIPKACLLTGMNSEKAETFYSGFLYVNIANFCSRTRSSTIHIIFNNISGFLQK